MTYFRFSGGGSHRKQTRVVTEMYNGDHFAKSWFNQAPNSWMPYSSSSDSSDDSHRLDLSRKSIKNYCPFQLLLFPLLLVLVKASHWTPQEHNYKHRKQEGDKNDLVMIIPSKLYDPASNLHSLIIHPYHSHIIGSDVMNGLVDNGSITAFPINWLR
jgi:hypothetical protein